MMKNSLVFALVITGLINQSCSQTYENGLKSGKNEITITMDDGVKLSTDVFIPKGKRKFPTVLVRTPYSKNAEEWMGKAFNLFRIAVVIQDVRGKYKSEGEFYPFINERKDGMRTLKWLREQSWSNGKVAGWGASYVGYTQWAISDSLDFLTLLLTGSNIYDFVHPDSLFSLQSAYIWGTENASHNLNKISKEKQKSGIMTLPVSAADDSTIADINFFNDWVRHDRYDDYWATMNFRGLTKAPVLSLAGWYDIFLKAQIRDFEALSSKNNPQCRMIIGPWCHGKQGEVNEYGGDGKTGKPTKIFNYVKNFLKENDNELTSPLKDSKYNLFIMERNEYVSSEVWPPLETENRTYYIGPSSYLGTSMLDSSGYLQYLYSPSNPFPSLGGTALGDGVGPARQNENLSRKDQVVFEMSVTDKPFVLLGNINATLWLSSSAQYTDFIVGIQDVFPDGKIINIQEGGAHVKFKSNKPEKNEISVWATGYQLNPGHKLRMVVSSSWFPRYNRSLNTNEPAFTATKVVDAEQKIFYGKDTPSFISLPVYQSVKE